MKTTRLPTGRPTGRARPRLCSISLRVAMARRDVSSEELVAALAARGVVVSRTTVSAWRRGDSRPTSEVRREVARVLGVRVGELEG